MSDGPYRSLPMRLACKRLAKRAQQSAFDPQEVAEAVCPALEAHWAAEVSQELVKGLRDLCDERQGSFFNERQEKIEALRRATAGGGSLGAVLVDCAAQALSEKKRGDDALKDAVHKALLDRGARDARTIEEHYYRESTPQKATHVHARILEGVALAPVEALAGQLVTRGGISNRAPVKHEGLDEGVSLP